MKLLLVKWDCYMIKGVVNALEMLQVDFRVFNHSIKDFEEDEEFEKNLENEIKSKITDSVFSINFFPIISKVCEKLGVKYISWGYDAPIKENAWKYLKNSCNEIYDFDRGQVNDYQKNGIKNVYHLPLASDVKTFSKKINQFPNVEKEKYRSQISFVGKLYTSDYHFFYSALNEHARGYIESCINIQKTITGSYMIPEILTEEIYQELINDLKEHNAPNNFSKFQIEYLLAQESVRRNRFLALSLLSKKYETVLYSTDKIDYPNVIQKGIVDYYQEMPIVFSQSKINLNLSLNAIKTGIPLRALDIMGCGGFLLSNPQSELVEYFCIGEECEVFGCTEELVEKVAFYLENDDIRKQIARKGLEKVRKEFCFENRIKRMLQLK